MNSSAESFGSVSVLGLGAIGSSIAQALLAAGAGVTVWNRTSRRAAPLVAQGAVNADSAAGAADASPLVLLCVTDYAGVGELLDVMSGRIAGRTVVVLTTGSPEEARRAARKANQAGAAYLDGGVQTGPEAVGTEDAIFFYSGDERAFTEHRTSLATVGTAHYLGTDAGAPAAQDLAMFGLWYDAQIAYLRALDTVRAAGIDVESFAPLGAVQLGHVVHATADTARELATRSFPRGPADLTEHAPVLDRLVALRRGQRLGDGDLDHIHTLVQQRIQLGHGHEGLTSILGSRDSGRS